MEELQQKLIITQATAWDKTTKLEAEVEHYKNVLLGISERLDVEPSVDNIFNKLTELLEPEEGKE